MDPQDLVWAVILESSAFIKVLSFLGSFCLVISD